MRWIAVVAMAAGLAACGQAEEEVTETEEATLDSYTAVGTEPGWKAELAGEELKFETPDGPNFTLPVDRVKQTDTGWEIRAYSGEDNITMTITSGEECSDSMSDATYADTVKVEVYAFGTQSGCGGESSGGEQNAEPEGDTAE